MTNIFEAPGANGETRLSNDEALNITHDEDKPELAAFVSALGMRKPVSTDQAAFLLEHMIKEQMSADTNEIALQMRTDHWENNLSEGESLEEVAHRAFVFLSTPEGDRLFNFFVKTFAKTSGQMFP
ncbi:MAG: hypothetical protein JWQ01_3781 [Massilia sp.]|jgi:hypothetical protein|nr:hypothetical protein [Massilia sp.]